MYDVLFITPNVRTTFVKESLGTLLLATILKNNGIKCKVLPFGHIGNVFEFDGFLENALTIVENTKPKIISMYTRCDTYHVSLKLAEIIKAKWNDIYIVLGGPQSDTTSTDVISQLSYIDYVCCGEGETTIFPFFTSLLQGKPDLSIPGLVYRQDGNVIKNPRPELIADLNSLPMIDLQGVYLNDYPEDLHRINFPIDVGRGCPFGCAYCSTQAFWGRKYRLKSPTRIVEEVKAAHNDFGVTNFVFSHDMFTFHRKTVIETCKLLLTLDFPIKWTCSARLDCLDPELIDYMVEAGMCRIFVGIETGSKRMQKLVHKNLNLDKVMDTLIYLHEKKIYIDTSFVYGFPEETAEDLSHTLSLISEIIENRCGDINTHLCAFLPKTELSELYHDQLTPTENYSNFTGDFAIKECNEIIKGHPALFPQLMEYKTPVRTSLKHFALFIRVWKRLAPIYDLIAKKYSKDHMIDMYYDFVKINKNTLEKYGDLFIEEAIKYVINDDKMHLYLENEPYYDLITDCRRMCITENSQAVKAGESVTAVYCFDPRDRNRVIPIDQYKRCIAVVNYVDKKMIIQNYPLEA